MTRRLGSATFLMLLVGALSWAVLHQSEKTRPNVLFVVWDTVRADRLSVYGHEAPTTPFLAEWSKEAMRYNRAISPSYWTLPAHSSLFTGLPVSTHGANANHKWLDYRFTTIAEHFSDNGYSTYAFSANPNIHRSTNTVQGFSTTQHPFGGPLRRRVERDTKQLLHPLDETTRSDPTRFRKLSHHKAGRATGDSFFSWLDESKPPNTPFFAFLNYMEAHTYRLPSNQARQAIMPSRAAFLRALKTSNLLRRQTNVMYGRRKPNTRGQRQGLYDLYDASIWDLDHYLEQLVVSLKARGLYENTIIVLTSDHGEQLGEHGLYVHNYSVYEPLVHVPLFIGWPKGLSPGVSNTPTSTAGLFSELVKLCSLPRPKQALTTFRDVVVTELSTPCAHPENRKLDFSIRDWSATYQATYQGGLKYIEASNGQHELYDLREDAKELHNLFPAHKQTPALTNQLQEWRSSLVRLALTDEERETENKKQQAAREQAQEQDLLSELVELGYLEP